MEQKARIAFVTRPPVGQLKLFLLQCKRLVLLYAMSEDEIKRADSSRVTLIAFEPFTSKFEHTKCLPRSNTSKFGPVNL